MTIPADLQNKLKPVTDIYIPKRKFDIAIDILDSIKKEYSHFDLVDYYIAMCHINLSEFKDAVLIFERLRSSKQLSIVHQIQTNMLLGVVYTELKELIKAEAAFKATIAINSQSSMSYSALGYVYFLSNRYDEALRNFKKAIDIDPNNAGAHNNLGFTYAEMGINLDEAITECRKAVTLNRTSAVYHDSLGWAYFRLNKFDDAIKELQAALDMDKKNTVINEHFVVVIKEREKHLSRNKY